MIDTRDPLSSSLSRETAIDSPRVLSPETSQHDVNGEDVFLVPDKIVISASPSFQESTVDEHEMEDDRNIHDFPVVSISFPIFSNGDRSISFELDGEKSNFVHVIPVGAHSLAKDLTSSKRTASETGTRVGTTSKRPKVFDTVYN